MTEKHIGVVIKQFDYDDNDQIITILTENEVLNFIALGVRKMTSKNRIALQLGNIIEVEIFRARLNNKLSKLKRAHLVKQLPILKLDTSKVWLEILKYISNINTPSRKLFNAILEIYKYWGTEYNHHIKTYILFYLLDQKGIIPNLNGCIDCGTKLNINGFEFYKGGFTCISHTNNKKSLKFLKGILSLSNNFEKYKDVDAFINKQIFQELIIYIKES